MIHLHIHLHISCPRECPSKMCHTCSISIFFNQLANPFPGTIETGQSYLMGVKCSCIFSYVGTLQCRLKLRFNHAPRKYSQFQVYESEVFKESVILRSLIEYKKVTLLFEFQLEIFEIVGTTGSQKGTREQGELERLI